jgi:hypothetical protein
MKRASLAVFGLVTACSSGNTEVGGPADASTDAPPRGIDAATLVDSGAADAPDGAGDPCADAGVPASTLACTGLYADFATKEVAGNALAYTPSSPLWSDGAQKQRWIELPPATQIDISNPDEWTFPVGTKVFKEFRLDGKRVETRMFQKAASNYWVYATYAWNSDDSAATINFGGPVSVGDGGTTWNIPTNDDCDECHRGRQDRILGFEQVGLGLPGAQGLTLAQLAEMGLVTPAPTNVSLTIGDDGTGLDALTLGWIHVNCGVTCHNANPQAAGYGAGMLLRLDPAQLDGTPPSATTWDILSTTIGVPCVSGSLVGQPRIRPGDASSSVIYQLIHQRGALQMPPIASVEVDTGDVAVVASWIQSMVVDGGAATREAGATDGGGRRAPDGGDVDAASAESGAPDATLGDGAGGADGGPRGGDTGDVDAESEESGVLAGDGAAD